MISQLSWDRREWNEMKISISNDQSIQLLSHKWLSVNLSLFVRRQNHADGAVICNRQQQKGFFFLQRWAPWDAGEKFSRLTRDSSHKLYLVQVNRLCYFNFSYFPTFQRRALERSGVIRHIFFILLVLAGCRWFKLFFTVLSVEFDRPLWLLFSHREKENSCGKWIIQLFFSAS